MTVSQVAGAPPSDTTDRMAFGVFAIAQVGMVVANLGRIPVFSTGDREAPIMVNELLLGLVIIAGVVVAIQRGALRLDRVALIALVFAAIGFGSAVWTTQQYGLTIFELAVSLAYLARWIAYALLYIVLINAIDRGHAAALWHWVETMLLIMATFGIIQTAFLPNFAQRVFPNSRASIDWDVQGNRLVSTILEPNIAAGMLMIGVLVQLALVSSGAKVQRWKIATLFVAMCLTLSRGTVLGFLVGLIVLLAIRGISRRLMRLTAAAAVLLLAALPGLVKFGMRYGRFAIGSGTSAGLRVVAWLQALTVFRDHPVFGIGFNTYAFVGERYGTTRLGTSTYASEGGLLVIAVTTGIVGLLVYCWMLATVVSNARRVWTDPSRDAPSRGLAIGVVAATAATIFQSIFVNSLLTTFVMEILWVLWATVAILARSPANAERRAAPRLVSLEV